jgi:hypothetical protein
MDNNLNEFSIERSEETEYEEEEDSQVSGLIDGED